MLLPRKALRKSSSRSTKLVEKVCYGELTAKEAAAQLLSAGNAALNK